MSCHDHEDPLLDSARGVPVDAAAEAALESHVHACRPCRLRLAQQRELTTGLRALTRSTEDAEPSAALDAELLDAFRGLHPVPVLELRARTWRAWMASAAALLVLVSGITIWMFEGVPDDGGTGPQVAATSVSEFVPWPGAASLPAFESGQLVRTELPASALPLLGLVPAGNFTGNTVTADVLVGQDGLARAVRLVKF